MERALFSFKPECDRSDNCIPCPHIAQCYHCMASQYFESRRDMVLAFKSFREALNFFEPDFHVEPDLFSAFKLDLAHMISLFENWLDFSVEFDHLVSAKPDVECIDDE